MVGSEVWDYQQKDGYKIYQSGSHIQGNFIQVFVPDNPYPGKLKLVTYLHGFALCIPKFYQAHLEVLAKNGYYVFFPDFQKSDYPEAEETQKNNLKKSHLSHWILKTFNLITQKSVNFNESPARDLLPKEAADISHKFPAIPGNLSQPQRFDYLRTSLAIVTIILVVKLVHSWFNAKYGKHLINLISTVGFSLVHQPAEWVKNAIALTEQSWEYLCKANPELPGKEFDFYVFGHSLGGLLALSWPIYMTNENHQKFFPQQIITTDPAPSTEMGIPQIAIWILKLFRSPFAIAPINISEIGSQLENIPIGIMHGADDTLVKPQSWIKKSFWQSKSNFDYIASQQKKIYFSLSNKHRQPPLIAFHNQAVTDTTYYEDALFENFGGVKKDPNDYNLQYIWPGLSLVVEDKLRVDQLLGNFPLTTVEVTDNLPDKA